MRNLQRRIDNAERALAQGSPDIEPRLTLLGLSSERASRLGQLAALDRVVALGDELIQRYPERPRAWLGRAQALSAVHRFAEASEALAQARKLGAGESDIHAIEATALLGEGKYERAHALLEKQRQAHASPINLTLEAVALSRLERFEEAEKGFQRALEIYVDVSPLLPAWVAFEHGNMWQRAGDEERATSHYREAIRLMPGYAHAAAHLAGSLPPDEAIPLFTRLQQQSDDPEYPASLARLLSKRDPARAKALMKQALVAYDALLAKHEAAFADHAAWFYLDIPERLKRAEELAEHAYRARGGVPEINELRLAIAMRQGDVGRICQVLHDAEQLAHTTAGLKLWLSAARAKCGTSETKKSK